MSENSTTSFRPINGWQHPLFFNKQQFIDTFHMSPKKGIKLFKQLEKQYPGAFKVIVEQTPGEPTLYCIATNWDKFCGLTEKQLAGGQKK